MVPIRGNVNQRKVDENTPNRHRSNKYESKEDKLVRVKGVKSFKGTDRLKMYFVRPVEEIKMYVNTAFSLLILLVLLYDTFLILYCCRKNRNKKSLKKRLKTEKEIKMRRFIDLFIARSTAQGHLRAFHSQILHKSHTKAFNVQLHVHKNKQKTNV